MKNTYFIRWNSHQFLFRLNLYPKLFRRNSHPKWKKCWNSHPKFVGISIQNCFIGKISFIPIIGAGEKRTMPEKVSTFLPRILKKNIHILMKCPFIFNKYNLHFAMTIEISCWRATLAPDVHKRRYTYIEARSYFRIKSNKTIFQNKIKQNTSPEQSCATFLFKKNWKKVR